MQISRRPITLKCNRPSATRRLARRSTSCARGHRGISLLALGMRGRLACHRLGPPFVCISMSKTVETWILQERRTSAVANREAGLPKNRVHAAKLSLSANPVVRYDAIGCDRVR